MQEPPQGFGFSVPEEANHLPLSQVMNAAKLTMFLHSNAFEHALVVIGDPTHTCDNYIMDEQEAAAANEENPDITWDDVRAFIAYEDSMKLVMGSFKNYMRSQGFPFKDDDSAVHER